MPPFAPLLTGQSLLPLLTSEPSSGDYDTTYASHQSHEISMYYPMRAVRTRQHKLILNLNYKMPFHEIDMIWRRRCHMYVSRYGTRSYF